jgi:hypothetical protein
MIMALYFPGYTLKVIFTIYRHSQNNQIYLKLLNVFYFLTEQYNNFQLSAF